eukprot:3327124-Pleurochrysis_carterae.AAC.2
MSGRTRRTEDEGRVDGLDDEEEEPRVEGLQWNAIAEGPPQGGERGTARRGEGGEWLRLALDPARLSNL